MRSRDAFDADLTTLAQQSCAVTKSAVFDLGEDAVLVFYLLRGRGRQSGAEVTLAATSVTKMRDSLAVYFRGVRPQRGRVQRPADLRGRARTVGPLTDPTAVVGSLLQFAQGDKA
jgi:hypothetical protein